MPGEVQDIPPRDAAPAEIEDIQQEFEIGGANQEPAEVREIDDAVQVQQPAAIQVAAHEPEPEE